MNQFAPLFFVSSGVSELESGKVLIILSAWLLMSNVPLLVVFLFKIETLIICTRKELEEHRNTLATTLL